MTDAALSMNVGFNSKRCDALLHLEDENLRRAFEQYAPGSVLDELERLTGGVSADVYRLLLVRPDGEKEQVVLRVHGATHYGHSAELEFQILGALERAGIPVPRPLWFDASCSLLDHPYLITAFLEGSTMPSESTIKTRVEKMVEKLVAVHQVPVGVMPALPRRADPVPEILEFLPRSAEWHDLRSYFKQLKNSPFAGPDVVLHGDYWPSNLIWSEGRIAAILDWEDAAVGDPLSDVACACLELRYIHGTEGKLLFESAYAKHRSIDANRLAMWFAYVSSAALKYMGEWGLESSREEHMRNTARDTLRESAALLL